MYAPVGGACSKVPSLSANFHWRTAFARRFSAACLPTAFTPIPKGVGPCGLYRPCFHKQHAAEHRHCQRLGLPLMALRLAVQDCQDLQSLSVEDVVQLCASLGCKHISSGSVDAEEQLEAMRKELHNTLHQLLLQRPHPWEGLCQLADVIVACEAVGLAWDALLGTAGVAGFGDPAALEQLSVRQLTQVAIACCERCAPHPVTHTLLAHLSAPKRPDLPPDYALALLQQLLDSHRQLPGSCCRAVAQKCGSSLWRHVRKLQPDQVALVVYSLSVVEGIKVQHGLLLALAERFGSQLEGASAQSISRALKGFARLQWRPPLLRQQVVSHLNRQPVQLHQFTTSDAVDLLWALARLHASGPPTLNLIKTTSILLLLAHTALPGSIQPDPVTSWSPTLPSPARPWAAMPPSQSTLGALQAVARQLATNIMSAASAITKASAASPSTAFSSQRSATPGIQQPLQAPPACPASSSGRDISATAEGASESAVASSAHADLAPRRRLTAKELSVVAWACVRCGYTNKTLLSQLMRLLMAAAPAATAPSGLPPMVVAQAVWACGHLRCWQQGLEQWTEAHLMGPLMDAEARGQNIAMVAWGMAACGQHPTTQFADAILHASTQAMDEFEPRELSALLWALGSWKQQLPHSVQEALLKHLETKLDEFGMWDMCNAVVSLDRLLPSLPHRLLSLLEQRLLCHLHPLHYVPLSWFLLSCQRNAYCPTRLVLPLCQTAAHYLICVSLLRLDKLKHLLEAEAKNLGVSKPVKVRHWPVLIAALVNGLGGHAGWIKQQGGQHQQALERLMLQAELEVLRRPALLPPGALAGLLWGMSEAQHVPSIWLQHGLHRVVRRAIPAMSFKHLSLTLLALSKWHQQRHLGLAQAAYAQAPAINRLLLLLDSNKQHKKQESGSGLWSCSSGWMAGNGEVLAVSSKLQPYVLVDVAAALSHLPCYSSRLLNTICGCALGSLGAFNGRTLTALLAALATLRHDEPRLLRAVSLSYPSHPSWQPPNLSSIQRLLSAYAKLNHNPGEHILQAVLEALERLHVIHRLEGMTASGWMHKPQNASSASRAGDSRFHEHRGSSPSGGSAELSGEVDVVRGLWEGVVGLEIGAGAGASLTMPADRGMYQGPVGARNRAGGEGSWVFGVLPSGLRGVRGDGLGLGSASPREIREDNVVSGEWEIVRPSRGIDTDGMAGFGSFGEEELRLLEGQPQAIFSSENAQFCAPNESGAPIYRPTSNMSANGRQYFTTLSTLRNAREIAGPSGQNAEDVDSAQVQERAARSLGLNASMGRRISGIGSINKTELSPSTSPALESAARGNSSNKSDDVSMYRDDGVTSGENTVPIELPNSGNKEQGGASKGTQQSLAQHSTPLSVQDLVLLCTLMYYLALMNQHGCHASIRLGPPLMAVLEANQQLLEVCGRWVGACLVLAAADGNTSPFECISAGPRERCMQLWREHVRKKSQPRSSYPVLRDVCKVLQSALDLETEASVLTPDGATSIDISFHYAGRQMALELLLPGRNCSRNTHRLSGEGSQRRRLQQARGYHVLYFSRRAWTGMGTNWEAKIRFVRRLLGGVPARRHLGAFDEVHIVEASKEVAGDGAGEWVGQEAAGPILRRPPSIGSSRLFTLRSQASRVPDAQGVQCPAAQTPWPSAPMPSMQLPRHQTASVDAGGPSLQLG